MVCRTDLEIHSKIIFSFAIAFAVCMTIIVADKVASQQRSMFYFPLVWSNVMKVAQKEVAKLLVTMGVKVAGAMPVERLQKRLESLPKLAEDDETPQPEDDEQKDLLKKLLKAIRKEEEIESVPTAKAEPEKTKAKAEEPDEDEAPVKSKKKAAKEEDEEEEEAPKSKKKAAKEEEDEDEEPKSKKAKKAAKEEDDDEKPAKKKKAVSRGPGIGKRIREIMEKTSEKKPMTKEGIVDILHEEFPDHNEKSLLKTVTGQVSYFLRDTNKAQKNPLDIRKNEKGYYVAS